LGCIQYVVYYKTIKEIKKIYDLNEIIADYRCIWAQQLLRMSNTCIPTKMEQALNGLYPVADNDLLESV
jgi:hypothetical protein